MTTTIAPPASTPAEPKHRTRPRLAILAAALSVVAVAAGLWVITRPDPALCGDVPGASGTVDLVAGGTMASDVAVNGRDFQLEFTGTSDLGVLTPVMQIHAEGFAVPVSIAAEAADGLPHRIALRFTDLGGGVEITATRDGRTSATTTQPGAIPSTVRVVLRGGEFSQGTVTVSQVACRLV